jgi:hypothetical protein
VDPGGGYHVIERIAAGDVADNARRVPMKRSPSDSAGDRSRAWSGPSSSQAAAVADMTETFHLQGTGT